MIATGRSGWALRPRVERLWSRTSVSLAFVALLLTFAGLADTALAGGVGSWSDLTGATGTNLTQVDTVRTADGTLWVVYERAATPGADELVVRSVTATGSLGEPVAVQAGWSSINQPAVVLLPDGQLRVFFCGIRSTDPTDPYSGLTYATSGDGVAWTLAPGTIDDRSDGSSAHAGDVAAVVLSAGTALQTWSGSNGVWVHRDYAPAPGTQFEYGNRQLGGGFGSFSDLAANVDGVVWLAWAANVTGKQGVWVQRVDVASGAPIGAPAKLPGSSTLSNGVDSFAMMTSRVPMAVRAATAGGGVYAAYPTGYPRTNRVRLWRLGGAAGTVIAGGDAAKGLAAVAADPGGRIWVVWSQTSSSGRPVVYARRSDPNATAFGATVSVMAPKGKDAIYHLAAAAQAGRLDVLAHFGPQEATWHTQLLAGLSVSVWPAKLKVGKKATVTVSVRDAGQPVAGAAVKLGGKNARTNAFGKAKLSLGPYGVAKTLKGTVKMGGYAAAATSVRVRK